MKKTNTVLLAIFIIALLFIPARTEVLAYDLDEDALELFLGKLVNMSDEKREFGALVLQEYFADGDEGIDALVEDIGTLGIIITEDDIDTIESYGYSIRDVQNELKRLKDWSDSDRTKLVTYIGNGDASSIEALILENESSNSDNTGGNTGGTTPETELPTTPSTDNIDNTESETLIEINFTDISNHWAKDSIEYLAQRGIITGRSTNIFDPEGKITRAEFTALIVRLSELTPQANNMMYFSDMDSEAWYYELVKAAYDNGIINGLNKGSFGPNENISREQMVSIIIRILEQKGILSQLEPVNKELSQFSDSGQVSSWAISSMAQALKYGLISGRSDDVLAPKDNTTRAEAATIVMKLYDVLNK